MKKMIACFLFLSAILSAEWVDEVAVKLEKLTEKEMKAWEIPGLAIGIIQGDRIVLAKGFGVRGLNDNQPVDEHTLFQIGSLSKAFTSALVAIGVDQGLFKWNSKVTELVPDFQLKDPFASHDFEIADLLSQRSGLPAHAGDTQALLGFTAKEMLNNLKFLNPVSSFRSHYAYQNIFFLTAAEALKAKTGLSYEALLKQELFEKLGMRESSASMEDYLASPNRAQWLLRSREGKVIPLKNDSKTFKIDWNYELGPAGGINSNVHDMINWVMLQANEGRFKDKQLISSENMQAMHRPMIYMGEADNLSAYYALGWVQQEYSPYPIIWHNGATMGAYGVAAIMPEEKLGIVILSNVRGTELAQALMRHFFDLYFKKPETSYWSQKFLKEIQNIEKGISEKKDLPQKSFSPMPLEEYLGTYQNPIWGNVTVGRVDSDLVLTIGKEPYRFILKPYTRDIFTMVWPDMEEEPWKVAFTLDSEGVVNQMDILPLSQEGDGTFKKLDAKKL